MILDLSEQAQAALAEDCPILVLGGPGSGKTTLSLLKAQRMMTGLKTGQEILFLSFSRAAVRQVLTRCKDLLTFEERQNINVKTYHAFCMDILRAHGRLLTGVPARLYFPGPERVGKAAFDGDWEAERLRLATEDGLYVFDLFASSSAGLLARSSSVCELIADKYPVIIVDEFQDTDDAQWELVKILSVGSRLVILADPDQRIFEYDLRVDPRRLDLLREFLHPAEFDLGGENHRSPDAGILQFADAILHNRELPDTADVQVISYWSRNFESQVHAALIWTLSALRQAGITEPSVAVLCRANPFVADLSAIFSVEHAYNGYPLRPVDHDVVWDAELTAAAAQVIASILEWPDRDISVAVSRSLTAIADYFEVKNSIIPSASARNTMTRYRTASKKVAEGAAPRPRSAIQLIEAFNLGIEINGDPAADWIRARDVIAQIPEFKEVHANERYVRLFRATDEIGNRLAQEWSERASYGNASEIVKRTLNMGRIISNQRDPRGCLIMTMHKSKGKEFDAVVLVEGKYKSKFFDEGREEEPFLASRRLLRVGITRARHKVVIVRPADARALIG